jgi:predicted DNA-binding transcriptional regulator AlpA
MELFMGTAAIFFEKAFRFFDWQDLPMSIESPFIFPIEVEQVIPLADLTRRRMERRGLFPKRIRVSPKRIAWRRSEIEAWVRDPEGWPNRQQETTDHHATDLAEDL